MSALDTSQRVALDVLLTEARPWALRQAERTYRHLAPDLRERAVERAFTVLRTGAPVQLDRRALYAALAEALTAFLREIHSHWCLDQAQAVWGRDAARPATAAGHPIAGFVDAGLAGLERAVLQLEIGAGRDTATARAALRLGPRAYRRHRDEGLEKLRGAVAGLLRGRVCEDHLEDVTMAATGDRIAAAHLSAGPARCRSCAREAGTVRRVLHERLALAPWPLVIKPAGIVAAKLGAIGAIFGGNGSTAGGTVAGGSLTAGTAKAVAFVAAAALATGGVAAVDGEEPAHSPAAVAQHERGVPDEAVAGGTTTDASERRTATRRRGAARRRQADRQAARRRSRSREAAAGQTTTASTPGTAVPPAQAPLTQTLRATQKVVDGVRRTVDETVSRPPRVRLDARTGLPDVRGTVDAITGSVESLLGP